MLLWAVTSSRPIQLYILKTDHGNETQRTLSVKMTTSHRRHYDVISASCACYVNILKYLHFSVFTEKPYTKPLERNVVYIRITTSGHVTSK